MKHHQSHQHHKSYPAVHRWSTCCCTWLLQCSKASRLSVSSSSACEASPGGVEQDQSIQEITGNLEDSTRRSAAKRVNSTGNLMENPHNPSSPGIWRIHAGRCTRMRDLYWKQWRRLTKSHGTSTDLWLVVIPGVFMKWSSTIKACSAEGPWRLSFNAVPTKFGVTFMSSGWQGLAPWPFSMPPTGSLLGFRIDDLATSNTRSCWNKDSRQRPCRVNLCSGGSPNQSNVLRMDHLFGTVWILSPQAAAIERKIRAIWIFSLRCTNRVRSSSIGAVSKHVYHRPIQHGNP